MGLIEHLGELRKRIFISAISIFVFMVLTFNYAKEIVGVVIESGLGLGYKLVYLSPSELFMQYVRISIVFSIILSSPVILYQVWVFIKPGLKKGERYGVIFSLIFGFISFVLGVTFTYFVVLPTILQFFIMINEESLIIATISIQNYLDLYISTTLTFGAVFELPILIVMLTQLGLVNPNWLINSRRVVVVAIFVIAAIITPPDIVSQMLLAFPMILLFEISILFSRIIKKRRVSKN